MLELTGVLLLFVGVVLFVNSMWLLGKVDSREIVFIDTFVGILSFLIAYFLVFNAHATPHSVEAGGLTLLFSCTYLWVAYNQYHKTNGKGLGWYCFFVALTAIPVAIHHLCTAQTTWEIWFGLCWSSWVVLWSVYFLHLAQGKLSSKTVGWITLVIGVATAWVPGYLLLVHLLS